MTDDDDRDERPRRGGSGGGRGGGGGGGGLGALFALILFAFRHPKLTLVAGVVIALFVVFSDDVTPTDATDQSEFATGATLDPAVYDEALVYEPLAEGREQGPPERYSLIDYAPTRRSQGRQGSCVGWATGYAARTILDAKQSGRPPDDVAFSPAFIYNPIALDDCNGTYLKKALEGMERNGALSWSRFPYDETSCSRRPDDEERREAQTNRIAGFTRLSLDTDDYRTNSEAVKTHLAQGAPVVIGMRVGGSFSRDMYGKKVWTPLANEYDQAKHWGGHAMAVIGYDDMLEGGAFQLMNSWGHRWGENGVAWVRYSDFDHFVREAFGLYPMGSAVKRDTVEQQIRFGLVTPRTLDRLSLRKVDALTWRTTSPISKGDRFKVEFSNTRPVYTYIFGQESDGSSYVLFPYTDKHSPYCGTTGTRIFPRKQSLTADEVGTRDSIAVVISPKALDFHELNERISAASPSDYPGKLRAALGRNLSTQANVRSVDRLVELRTNENDPDKLHALVIEFDKR